jgi:type II secretory pathway pseudopilin PulG
MSSSKQTECGFSLFELLIAMVVTLTLMTAGTTLLANALRARSRENQKSDALADTQRALNIMSREIANAGLNLQGNGVVDADSGSHEIRVRSNLNKYDPLATAERRAAVLDPDEDITYFINEADKTKYLVRHDDYGSGSTVLANRIDSMNVHYFAEKVTYTAAPGADDISDKSANEVSPSAAKYIVIAVSVHLDQIGTPGATGFQPQYSVLLCSDVILRNSDLWKY